MSIKVKIGKRTYDSRYVKITLTINSDTNFGFQKISKDTKTIVADKKGVFEVLESKINKQ